jgi:hypothetical protein
MEHDRQASPSALSMQWAEHETAVQSSQLNETLINSIEQIIQANLTQQLFCVRYRVDNKDTWNAHWLAGIQQKIAQVCDAIILQRSMSSCMRSALRY